MQENIYKLRKALYDLEKNTRDQTNVKKNVDLIIEVCNHIKKDIKVVDSKISVKEKFQKLNSLPFLYKPITRKDYLSGNYLEKFSEERTSELKDANAIDIHNEFWVQHQPIKGNIFGSVPKELLNEKTIKSLERSSWKEVLVNIYETAKVERKELIKYCDENFSYYILIQEKRTSAHLILEYNI